jgi:hypothetical protein
LIEILDLLLGGMLQVDDFIGQVLVARVDLFQQFFVRVVTLLGQLVEARPTRTAVVWTGKGLLLQ